MFPKVFLHAAAYSIWIWGFRLIALTLITYNALSTSPRLQDISEIYRSNEIAIFGLSALLYVVTLIALNPMTSTHRSQVFTPLRFEKAFLPGFAQGSGLAIALAFAFLIAGTHQANGFTLSLEDAPLALASILARSACLVLLVYFEEFLFRQKILNSLRSKLPELRAAGATSLLYCVVKELQFDLGWLQLLALFLISMTLSLRHAIDGDFVRGAGFWAGLFVVLHAFLGLPLFGSEFQGLLLIKYIGSDLGAVEFPRLLTGGAGGPLSSLALLAIVAVELLLLVRRRKS